MTTSPNTPPPGFVSQIPGTATKLPPYDSGWYVFAACLTGVLLSGTPAAPILFGLISLGTLYQFNMLLQHK